MLLETPKDFLDFSLLDSGSGFRLEKLGGVILARPDPQIIWPKSRPQSEWDSAQAVFKINKEDAKGKWQISQPLPEPWLIHYQNVKFLLKLSPFKHTGLFPEQAVQWQWMTNQLKVESYKVIKKNSPDTLNWKHDNFMTANKSKVLNLFAYTGGATVILAQAGCLVTHVDASRPAINWAHENQRLNGLPADSVRWILDDAVKFVKRELKRGAQYDGIIMDPPAFGHSPQGKTWKFNQDLPSLLADCVKLLSPQARFLIVNGYATNSSALALNNLLTDTMLGRGGTIEFGELCLKQKSGRIISTGIFARWSA